MTKLHFVANASLACVLIATVSTASRAGLCPGDCNGDCLVSIDELVKGVAMALSSTTSSDCEAMDGDQDDDRRLRAH
jgi:hypothetical protein